jgi:RHS repeat-associated protein
MTATYVYDEPQSMYLSAASNLMNQNTSKERDAETGLDYFGARYYSGAQGRFTSSDPVIVTPARIIDPQRFNLFSYARNNPFLFIDPTGEDIEFVNDTEEGRDAAFASITQNLSSDEATNIGMRKKKKGKGYEAYILDEKAFGKSASIGYKRLTGLIKDHSVVADVGLVGGGFTATYEGIGQVSSWGDWAVTFGPLPGSNHAGVLVTQGNLPGGVQVWNGNQAVQGPEPDYVAMWHELVGETRKYRTAFQNLRKDPVLDSKTIIEIENECRAFHGMDPRTGSGHGNITIVITSKGQVK